MSRRAGQRASRDQALSFFGAALGTGTGNAYLSPPGGGGATDTSGRPWIAPFDLEVLGIFFQPRSVGATGTYQFHLRVDGVDDTSTSLTVASSATAGSAESFTPRRVPKGSAVLLKLVRTGVVSQAIDACVTLRVRPL